MGLISGAYNLLRSKSSNPPFYVVSSVGFLRINGPVKEFIESYYRGQPIPSTPITADLVRKDKMRTPFQDMFIRFGYNPEED